MVSIQGFRAQGLGSRVWVLGFRVEGVGGWGSWLGGERLGISRFVGQGIYLMPVFEECTWCSGPSAHPQKYADGLTGMWTFASLHLCSTRWHFD